MKYLITLLLFSLPMMPAFSAGVMQLKGTVVAFSKDEVTLEVKKKKLYILDRTGLAPADSAKIAKAGEEVNLGVPLQAVKNVKEVK